MYAARGVWRTAAGTLVAALLALTLVVVLPHPAAALHGKGKPHPTLSRVSKVKTGAKFFGPAGWALVIGLAGWELYQYGTEEGWWGDPDVQGPEATTYHTVWYSFTTHVMVTAVKENASTDPWIVKGSIRNCSSSARVLRWTTGGNVRYESPGTVSAGAWHDFETTLGSGTGLGGAWRSRPEGWINCAGYESPTALSNAQAPPEADPFHPTTQRSTVVEYRCIDASGTITSYSVTGPSYGSGEPVTLPAGECPAGSVLVDLHAQSVPDNGTGTAVDLVETEGPHIDVYEDYEECFFVVPPAAPCELDVLKRLTPSDPESDLEKCDEFAGNCTNWWWHSDREARFECHWGPYVLETEQCRSLAYYYNPGTEGQLTPEDWLIPPTAPQQQPTETEAPGPGDPVTPPATPEGSTETVVTLPPPTPGPEHGDASCWQGLAIGWNPVSWVLEPVKCALTWAFVPAPATVTSLQLIPELFEGKAPFSVLTAVNEYRQALEVEGGGCIMWEATVQQESYAFVDSCTPDVVSGWIMARRSEAQFIVWGSLLIPLGWWAWRQYAPGSQGMA